MLNHRYRDWAIALGVAFLYTAAQTTQLVPRIPGVPWLELFLYELPVWCSLLAVSPAIVFVSRRLPLLGPRTLRNTVLHLLPAALILLAMFFLVESTRQFVISPLVRATDLAVTPRAIEYRDFTVTVSLFSRAIEGFSRYKLFFLFTYYSVVILHQAVVSYRRLMEAQVRAEQLETLLARSQLDALKLQLQPHFLFNTLNTVSSLMSRDILLARRTLARLSDLLRQSLRDSGRHEVSLSSELEFLDAYIEIQQARFGPRLIVAKDIEPRSLSILIPRMLLQPLVENSIRHGMRDGDESLVVNIRVARVGDVLRITVYDNGRGIHSEGIEEGLGLRNTRDRLEQLYRDDYDLTFQEPPGGGFEVAISIPVRVSDEEDLMEVERDIA